MADVFARLRSPRGTAWLFGVTFTLGLALALVMANTRWFFERYVREKYPAPSGNAQVIVEGLRAGRPTAPVKPHCAEIYASLMTAPASETDAAVARALAASDPVELSRRLDLTFAAGSQEQKLRAARIAGLASHALLVPPLKWALLRAESTRNAELRAALREALSASGAGD